LEDAVEDEREREHERGNVACCYGVGEARDEHVRKGASEDEELDAEE
jgi:hypothetical protein